MPFGKELSHIIGEQINKAVAQANGGSDSTAISAGSGADAGRIALLEANLQRLAEQFAGFVGLQKQSKRNIVEYGLSVIALHDLRLAVTSGRAVFAGCEQPLDMPYTYLQLADAGAERQIRYIYLNNAGVVLESSTDPTNIGADYLPLAMVDMWSGVLEITQDKIKDLRPRAGSEGEQGGDDTYQLTGNATLFSPDTGNDSFVVSATEPAGLQVNVSSGRALVDGEILNAQGGLLDLTQHRQVNREFLAFSDGATTVFNLYHKAVANVVVYVNDTPATVTVDAGNGSVSFAAAPAADAKIEASYTFGGNYQLLFLVEKALTNEGSAFGSIGWKVGSNRLPNDPPVLAAAQHAIAKVDMSGAISAITGDIIDNSYEVSNLSQYDLQYGEKLEGSSLKDGVITGRKVAAAAITGEHILAGSVESANLKAGAVTADKIAAGAISTEHLAANAIKAETIETGAITADKFESATWGDLSQAMRFVKAILGGEQNWKQVLSQTELDIGVINQVAVSSQAFPSLRLGTQRHWDDGTAWDTGTWDIPVYANGFWESASFDYGVSTSLQAEFWAVPVIVDPAVSITVKAKYSEDNVTFTDYETLIKGTGLGYDYWLGSLRQYRYFKIRVEFATTDTGKYALLGYPEVRASNCQIGSEDLSNAAVTTEKVAAAAVTAPKMAAGALANNISIISGTLSNGATIPLPAGYTQSQCKWLVRHDRCLHSNTGATTGIPAEVAVNPSTLVVNSYWRDSGGSGTQTNCQASATIYYLVIGIK